MGLALPDLLEVVPDPAEIAPASDVAVLLPGGELRIAWPDDAAQVAMSGPAAFVFEGEWTG